MAKLIFTEAVVTVNAVDLSDHVSTVTIEVEADEQTCTNFASGGWTEILGGIKSWSISIDWFQDYAAAEVDDTLWALIGTLTAVTVKPTTAATSATNPQYSGSVLVGEYSPIDATVGDVGEFSTSWNSATALTRATS